MSLVLSERHVSIDAHRLPRLAPRQEWVGTSDISSINATHHKSKRICFSEPTKGLKVETRDARVRSAASTRAPSSSTSRATSRCSSRESERSSTTAHNFEDEIGKPTPSTEALFYPVEPSVRHSSLDELVADEHRARIPEPPVCDGPTKQGRYRRKLPKLPASHADTHKLPVETFPNLLTSRSRSQSRSAHEEKPCEEISSGSAGEEEPLGEARSPCQAAHLKNPLEEASSGLLDDGKSLSKARSQSSSSRTGRPRKPQVDPFANWLEQRRVKEEQEQQRKREEYELAQSCRRSTVVADRFVFRCLGGEDESPQDAAIEEPVRSNPEPLRQESKLDEQDDRETCHVPVSLWTTEAFDEMPLETHELKETMRSQGSRAFLKKLQRQRSWDVPDDDYQAAAEVFNAYDINGDGKLSAQEMKEFLNDQGVRCESALQAKGAIETVVGTDENFIDLDGFVGLIAYDKAERRGYCQESQKILRRVFDAYDTNHTGSLECREFSQLLSDLGHIPRTRKESEELAAMVYSCRESGTPGPLSFPEFVLLAQRLDQMDVDAGSE